MLAVGYKLLTTGGGVPTGPPDWQGSRWRHDTSHTTREEGRGRGLRIPERRSRRAASAGVGGELGG